MPPRRQRWGASVSDPHVFKTGRCVSVWLGLVPRQHSSGGKERLGGITKAGDTYLRTMLFVGAMAVIRHAERYGTRKPWLIKLLSPPHTADRGHRTGQPARSDRLGTDDQPRALPRTGGHMS